MNIEVKNLISIFTVIDGELKLISNGNNLIEIDCNEEFEKLNKEYIKNNLKIENISLKQYYTFSNKIDSKLVISILFMGFIDYNSIEDNKNIKFISINDINKKYLDKILECLKKELVSNNTMKILFPEEFALPDIQKIYEILFGEKIDRRNFRKRLIKLDILEDLDKISSTKAGRPAKLYRFKNTQKEINLF